jgi:type IV pilus assembly protein PilE
LTLVELLVTLAIVGILSALAWPGYRAIIERAQRGDARLALLRLQHLQERHYATHLRYAGRVGTTDETGVLLAPGRTASGSHELAVVATADGQGYTAIASVIDGGHEARDPRCQRLSIDHTGRRRSADTSGAWSDSDPHRCWG